MGLDCCSDVDSAGDRVLFVSPFLQGSAETVLGQCRNRREMDHAWTPTSWRSLPIKQQPEYEDKEALAQALAKVKKLPPIVHQMEIEKLKSCLAQACEGKMFLLQVHP